MFRSAAKGIVLLAPWSLVAPALAQWEQRQPANSPGPRESGAVAFDSLRQRAVLFGGSNAGAVLGDTWEWDGTTWARVNTATSPSPRRHAAMAFDEARRRIVLFGGADLGARFGDTWTYDGTNWTRQTPSRSPSARSEAAMAFERAGNRVLLFGGSDGTTSFNDTWVFDGTDWAQAASPTRPFPRWSHALATEPSTGGVLLFGGLALQTGVASINDTWLWSGGTWTIQNPTATPTARAAQALFNDVSRDRIVMFGGAYVTSTVTVPLADTWSWDAANRQWNSITAGVPGARSHMSACDGPTGAVMFGGRGASATASETWVLRQLPQPVFPSGHERREGNEAYGGTFAAPRSRTQVAMAAAGFDPAFRAGTIRGIRFRRDASGGTFLARRVTMRLYLGVAGRSPQDLSTHLFDNWARVPTLVHQGVLDIAVQPPPTPVPPARFEVAVPFQLPFSWGGETLLYDIEVLDNSLPAPLELDAATQLHPQGALSRFGQACRNPAGSLLTFPDPPVTRLVTGGGIDARVTGATPGGLAISLVGDSSVSFGSLPLPFTFPGSTCTLYTNVVLSPTQIVSAAGTASISHAIPSDPRFAGLRAFTQWAVYEGASIYPPLTLSDALQVTVGAVPPVLYDAVLNLDGSNTGVRLTGRYACLVTRLDL